MPFSTTPRLELQKCKISELIRKMIVPIQNKNQRDAQRFAQDQPSNRWHEIRKQ